MHDKHINWDLIMHFSYSLLYLLVLASGAVIVELMARGTQWLGVSDFSYYLLSGTAHLMLAMDVVLLVLVLFFSARKLLRGAANEN